MTHTICFTGHRHIPDEDAVQLNERLRQLIEELIAQGAAVFRTGGAIGFDTYAALNILFCRKQHPHIRLELVLPYPNQTDGWRESDRSLYRQILEQADSYRYISQHYYNGALQARNRALVDGADTCVAYLRSSRGGGTAYTAAYALKQGLDFYNLQDMI